MTNPSGGKAQLSLIGIAEVLMLLAGLFLIVSWKRLPPEVPWLYSLPWGGAQLISKSWFGVGLLVAMAVNLVNWVMAKRMARRDPVAATVIESASLLLTLMYLAAFFKVVSIIM